MRFVATLLLSALLSLGLVPASAADAPLFDNLPADASPRIDLPSPNGPWKVGTVTYHWIDRDRQDLVDERSNHQIVAQLWYPTLESPAPQVEYFPELELFRLGLSSLKGDRPSRDARRFARLGSVFVEATTSSPVAPGARRLPVLIFSPGGNMSRHFHTSLFLELASHGYLVVAMSHKYSTWDVFPAGGFALSRPWPDEESLTDYLATDAVFVINRLHELDKKAGSNLLAGRIDLNRIAILGHSRGGKTVARVCSSDPRVDACVTLDNIGPAAETEAGLDKPQLIVRTDDERSWSPERIDELRGFLQLNSTGAREVVVHGANHNDFSDLPIVDPEGFPSTLDQSINQGCVASIVMGFVSEALKTKRGAESNIPADCSIDVFEYGRQ